MLRPARREDSATSAHARRPWPLGSSERGRSVTGDPPPATASAPRALSCAGLPSVTRQELSELREVPVLRDEDGSPTGEAVLRPLSNDAPARGYRLHVAPTAALLAR